MGPRFRLQSPQYTELLEEESLPTAAAALSRASLNVVGRQLSEAEAVARAAMLDVLQTPTLQVWREGGKGVSGAWPSDKVHAK